MSTPFGAGTDGSNNIANDANSKTSATSSICEAPELKPSDGHISPIARLPMTNLTVVFSFLSVYDLFPAYRTCKLLASAISNPLLMKIQSRISEDKARATVQLVGPVPCYDDPLKLNAALHNPILRNMRFLHLEAPSRIPLSHNHIFAMLEMLRTSGTSLIGLKIQPSIWEWNSFSRYTSDTSDTSDNSFSLSSSIQGGDRFPHLLSKSSEQLYSEFLANKKQIVSFKIPSYPHPLVADPYPLNRCDKCDTFAGTGTYRSQRDLSQEAYCFECIGRTKGLDYSEESYLRALPTQQYEQFWRSFVQNNCVSFLKYLCIDGPPSACDSLTLHLPHSLKILHLNIQDVISSANPFQYLDRSWTDRFPKDLPQRLLRAPNLKRLILCELNSDLVPVEPTLAYRSTLRVMTSLVPADFEFLAQLSDLLQLEQLQLPILLTSWEVGTSSSSSSSSASSEQSLIRKIDKLFLSPQYAEPYLVLFQRFPDLTSLYVKSFHAKRGIDFPKLQFSASTAASLTELSLGLEMNEFGVQPMLDHYEAIKLPHLTTLTLQKQPPIISKPSHGMYSMGKFFQQCVPNLTELSLMNFRAMIDFGEDFRQLKHLRHLKNFYWKRPASHKPSTSLHEVFPSLVSLHVLDCDVTDGEEKQTAQCVAHLLQTIPHLRSVQWMSEEVLEYEELDAYLAEHASISREIHTGDDESSTIEGPPTFLSFFD